MFSTDSERSSNVIIILTSAIETIDIIRIISYNIYVETNEAYVIRALMS